MAANIWRINSCDKNYAQNYAKNVMIICLKVIYTMKQKKKNWSINKSFSCDVTFALSKGKFLTSKHCAVGLGLHSLLALKQPVSSSYI